MVTPRGCGASMTTPPGPGPGIVYPHSALVPPGSSIKANAAMPVPGDPSMQSKAAGSGLPFSASSTAYPTPVSKASDSPVWSSPLQAVREERKTVGAPFDTPRKSVRARYPGWECVNRHLLPRAGPPRQKPEPEAEQTGPTPNGAKTAGDDVGKKKRESTATSSRGTSASKAKERSDAKETTPKTTDKLSKGQPTRRTISPPRASDARPEQPRRRRRSLPANLQRPSSSPLPSRSSLRPSRTSSLLPSGYGTPLKRVLEERAVDDAAEQEEDLARAIQKMQDYMQSLSRRKAPLAATKETDLGGQLGRISQIVEHIRQISSLPPSESVHSTASDEALTPLGLASELPSRWHSAVLVDNAD